MDTQNRDLPVDITKASTAETVSLGEEDHAILSAEYVHLLKETEDLKRMESEVDADTLNLVLIPAIEENIRRIERLKECIDSSYWENKEDDGERAKIEAMLAGVRYRVSERERRKIPIEKVILDTNKYRDLAEYLYNADSKRLDLDLDAAIDDDKGGISDALRKIPKDILKNYAGHGMVRGIPIHEIANVMSVLENDLIIGEIAPLYAEGRLAAYSSGCFLIVSGRGGFKGPDGTGGPKYVQVETIEGKPMVGRHGTVPTPPLKVQIGAVVCNAGLDALVEPLRKMFPNRKILHASELADYIYEQEKMTG